MLNVKLEILWKQLEIYICKGELTMKKMRKNIDALLDIVIIAVLVFTILMVVSNGLIKFLLIVAGCGAMFNN